MAHAYDDAKRAAVLAALLEGQSVHQVARDFNITRATIIRWRDAAGISRTRVEPEKRDDIGELVAGVLFANLHAIQVLADRIATEEEWFRKQPASDIAVLSGVLTDKAVRILEALESAGTGPVIDVESPALPEPAG